MMHPCSLADRPWWSQDRRPQGPPGPREHAGPDDPRLRPPFSDAGEYIESRRLIGRRLSQADLDDFTAYYGDAAVMSSVSPDGRPYDVEAATALFDGHLDHWSEHRFGTWVFRDAEGRFVGRAGVTPALWRLGYATEMAQRIVSVAFGEMAIPELVAFTLSSNGASLRVLGKCGFVEGGELLHAGLRHRFFGFGPTSIRTACRVQTHRPVRMSDSARLAGLKSMAP